MEFENGSTSTRLNRAKSQYESILMGLHLPTENDVTESFIQTRNMRDTYPLYLTDTDDNGLVEDMNAEDIIVSQQVFYINITHLLQLRLKLRV